MVLRPTTVTRTAPIFPYPTLFLSIGLMRNPLTVDEARVLEANGYGERILDTANAELNALIELARELTASNEQAVESSFHFTLPALLIGTAVAMLFPGDAWFVLLRAISAPITALSPYSGKRA